MTEYACLSSGMERSAFEVMLFGGADFEKMDLRRVPHGAAFYFFGGILDARI